MEVLWYDLFKKTSRGSCNSYTLLLSDELGASWKSCMDGRSWSVNIETLSLKLFLVGPNVDPVVWVTFIII